ncbi:MAG: hypothetical protein JXA60_09250 [Candidatus Coatesbacteria bacterium]|nr:hypothetical protein [Candidatus Coatesbacteria bacterium]
MKKIVYYILLILLIAGCSKPVVKETKDSKEVDSKEEESKKETKENEEADILSLEQLRSLRPKIPERFSRDYKLVEESATVNLVNKTSQITWLLFPIRNDEKDPQSAVLEITIDDFKYCPENFKAFTNKIMDYPAVFVQNSFMQIKVGRIRIGINGPGLNTSSSESLKFSNDKVFIEFIKNIDLERIKNL